VDRSRSDLEHWRGARILVTGGTGFIGSWLVGSLIHANAQLGLKLRVEVLSRHSSSASPDGFRSVVGDVRSPPRLGSFDLVVHAAASSGAAPSDSDSIPGNMGSTIIDGTRSILEMASECKARFLFLSSGAVYGQQTVPKVAETHPGGPDPMAVGSVYAEAKRMAENWCALANESGEIEAVVARLFAFVGPRLPTDRHFAAGNFMADVLARRPVEVMGDGRTVRSYLYAGDIPEWLLAMATRGVPGRAYNVGSPEAITIGELANKAASLVEPSLAVKILGDRTEGPPHRYVPDVRRAESELAVQPRVAIDDALGRTLTWLAAGN
jgi:nucleoside-diphosphate-sugar epimerase